MVSLLSLLEESLMARRGRPATEICRERPIIFSGPMVLAILEGRKTETRRVIQEQPEWENGWVLGDASELLKTGIVRGVKCPYGRVGDTLWVKETFRYDVENAIEYKADGRIRLVTPPKGYEWQEDDHDKHGRTRWRPSIHMPRWASRIHLDIEGLGVHRIDEITSDGAMAEGVLPRPSDDLWDLLSPITQDAYRETAISMFRDLWDHINAKRGYPWDDSPWIWLVQFRRISP
jgi:hypothetical protein